ncbi:MAG: 50S ribosomal protein L20 [Parcubacteria group bacterium]|nr:50S ribosomal protein L20 [Parcubacteria group bacterium]
MPRVKRGMMHAKRRKNILKATKGFKYGRQRLITKAQEAILHAGVHALRDRRNKKRTSRALWILRINNMLRASCGLTYKQFIPLLKQKNVAIDRKILADLAVNNPQLFEKIVESVK